MKIASLALPGLLLLSPRRHQDARGFLVETFQTERFGQACGMPTVIQENLVFSRHAGTVRGLHAQSPPHAQAKLVGVLAGRILDVVVDVRRGSPSFGRHAAVELSATAGTLLYVPRGFLHGYATLADETLVQYKLDAPYAPTCEVAVCFDDPALGIDWGVAPDDCRVSDKDRAAGKFADFASPFVWQETS